MIHDLVCLVCMVMLALLIRQYAVEIVRVKGASMRSALQNKEIMLMDKAAYRFGHPQRHDVVICHYPGRYMDKWKLIRQYFVKRVIGLPGETISIEEGVVHVDGVPLDEPYLQEMYTRRKINMEPVLLAEDEYFVMGDNRDNSNDSRRIGPLKRKALLGKVRAVLWPLTSLRKIR